MPRYFSLSNGRLLVNFDRQYSLRDFYWPHVGQENHTEGNPFRFGIYCDQQFSWVADAAWEKEIRYGDDALVSDVTLRRDRASRYTQTAERMKEAVAKAMWDGQANRFVRELRIDRSGNRTPDQKLDAALTGLWYFGMFDRGEPRIVSTMEAVRQRLWVQSPVGGLARYEDDQYHRVTSGGDRIPGNPWFVCTLWLAQWYIRKARAEAELQPAAELINWAASRALPNGLMAEQIHPFTDEPLSACPLTWSHSTFVLAVHEYMTKCRELHCGAHYLDTTQR